MIDDFDYKSLSDKELKELAYIGWLFKNLPHESTVSHGFSDITRDWAASWNLNVPESDCYFNSPKDVLEFLHGNS